MKPIKTAGIIVVFVLGYLLAHTQNITYQNEDSIRLPLNNPARVLPGIASAPGQGGDIGWNVPLQDTATQKWYCMNPAKKEVRLEENGFKIKTGVNLKTGALVTSDGKVIEQNSRPVQLQEGECISDNGEITP